jgi:8-oxo-dGTP diphosphatase
VKAGIDYTGITTLFHCHDGKGNFLLHKRSRNCRDEHGAWDTGGGQLDFGISIRDNVLKEVLEEYGCAGEIQEQLPPLDVFRELDGAKTHWLAIPFFVLVDPKQVKINEPEAIDEIGWFRLDNLPTPLHTGFHHVFKTFKDHFDKYQ